jgi:photosystem II stability/assembly factor-like uncharacterized protein
MTMQGCRRGTISTYALTFRSVGSPSSRPTTPTRRRDWYPRRRVPWRRESLKFGRSRQLRDASLDRRFRGPWSALGGCTTRRRRQALAAPQRRHRCRRPRTRVACVPPKRVRPSRRAQARRWRAGAQAARTLLGRLETSRSRRKSSLGSVQTASRSPRPGSTIPAACVRIASVCSPSRSYCQARPAKLLASARYAASRVSDWVRLVPLGLCLVAAVVGLLMALPAATRSAVNGRASVVNVVGPMRLVTRTFGYAAVARAVTTSTTTSTRQGLFLYDGGRRRDATPTLHSAGIEAVAFVSRSEGWVAAFNCAEAAVYLFRTTNGGRSWESLGKPSGHSCGGGPTFLSFIDGKHGWMEPVSPNGPGGELLRTSDGGRTWSRVVDELLPRARQGRGLRCLGPIRFVSLSRGWMGRCFDGGLFASRDGGHRWTRTTIRVPRRSHARFDLPWFDGSTGVVAATLGSRSPTEGGTAQAVAFSVSNDGGRTWSVRSTRRIASCPLEPFFTGWWPAAVADARVWWLVTGRDRPTVQVTTDAGQHWRTTPTRGLPHRPCSILSVSAANSNAAWVVTRVGHGSALFRTSDGGRTWNRTVLFPR